MPTADIAQYSLAMGEPLTATAPRASIWLLLEYNEVWGAKALEETVGTDEVSQLSSMFGSMASEVISREAALKQQVESLKIEVDLVKQQRAVSEITDSDFFKDLQSKARHLRYRDQVNTGQINISKMFPQTDVEETHPPTSVDNFISSEDEPASFSD